jgi:hypothetical protein
VKNLKPNFSHIYVEKFAIGYPLTEIALSKFSESTIVKIDHYKDIFNRKEQKVHLLITSM